MLKSTLCCALFPLLLRYFYVPGTQLYQHWSIFFFLFFFLNIWGLNYLNKQKSSPSLFPLMPTHPVLDLSLLLKHTNGLTPDGWRKGSQLCLFINEGPWQGRGRVGDRQQLPATSCHPKWGTEIAGNLPGRSPHERGLGHLPAMPWDAMVGEHSWSARVG